MSAEPTPKGMVSHKAPERYSEDNERRYRSQVERELASKHDKRADLRIGDGQRLVISSPGGVDYAFELTDEGRLQVTDYADGAIGELLIDFDEVEGLEQEFIDVRAEFAAADGSISSAYIAADAVVASDAASARATLSTNIYSAFQAADAGLQSDINTRATITYVDNVESSLEGSIASTAATLRSEFQAADAGLQNDINTRATITYVDSVESSLEGSIAATAATLRSEFEAGDANLQAGINNEASTRASAIAAEATARETLAVKALAPKQNLFRYGSPPDGRAPSEYGWAVSGPGGATLTAQEPNGSPFYRLSEGSWSGTRDARFSIDTSSFFTLGPWQLGFNAYRFGTLTGNVYFIAFGGPAGVYYSTVATLDGSDERRYVSATLPVGITSILIIFEGSSGSGLAGIDFKQIKLERGNEASAYSNDAGNLFTQATTQILRSAFVDPTTGEAAAAINLIAAASGGSPAEIEILSSAGGSGVKITGNTQIVGNLIVTGTIQTDGLALNAVTNAQVSQAAAAIALANETWTTVASFSFTSVGIGVEIRGTCTILTSANVSGTIGAHEWRLVRDSTVLKAGDGTLASETDSTGTAKSRRSNIVADYNDIVPAGAYTYKLEVKVGTTSGSFTTRSASNRYLSAREFKR